MYLYVHYVYILSHLCVQEIFLFFIFLRVLSELNSHLDLQWSCHLKLFNNSAKSSGTVNERHRSDVCGDQRENNEAPWSAVSSSAFL